jgi:adhesin/invasin
VSASQTLHTVAPATITASTGGTVSTITVTARDQFNNVIRGKSVTLAATGTGNTLTQPAALTNVNGVATGTLSSTVIGQKTVSVTVTGVAITQTRIVTVNPAAANRLAFVIQPTSATAGVAIAPAIQVEIRDQFENRTTSTAGVTLAIGTNPGGGTLTGGGPLNAVAGRATFPAASINRSGTGYTLTATSGSLTAATSTAFSITAAGVSASQSTVVAAPGSITASSGITTSTITVTARDQFGNPISGATVVLAASGSGNTLTQPVGTTSAGGVATGTLSSTVAQAKTVSATINTVAITQTAAVTVTPAAVSAAQSTVGAAPGSIVASSGGTTSTITVTARDLFNNPISGATVALAATGTGNALVQPGSTNASGVATGTISSTVAETKAVSATVNGLAVTQTASVTVTAAAVSAALSTVSAAPGSIVASSGGTTSTITVTARDQFSNPISGATVALAATGTGNGLVQPAGSTSASGVTTGTLSATVAQAKTVSATINSVAITQTASVTVTAAAVSAAQSTVSAAPGSIVASSGGATSTITVTARDQFSNPVGGATVALAASGSGNNLVQPVGTTSASGVATGTLSSTAAQAKTVSATINAVAITQTATVTVTAAAAAAIAVSAGNGQSAPVNTAVAVDPAVIVRDGFNNPVSGVTVTFTLTGGGGTIVPASPAAIQTDAAGIAALTTWTLGAASGVNTLSAASGSLSGSPVVFTATATSGPVSAALSSVGAAPGSIAASSGATTSTVTVTARDQSGNPIAGATVVVAATGSGNTVTQPGVTNASGVATGALSSTAAETKTVSATINGVAVTQTAAVIVTPAAVSAGQSLVSAAPASIVASGGGATSTITVTARDQFTNPVNGATVVLSATGTGNTLAQPAGTNASGVATGTLSSTVAQTKTVAATINGVPVTQTATVTVTAAAAAAIAVSAGNGQTATVNTAVATAPAVVVHDAFGNPVGGVEVAFTVTAGGGSILPAAPSIATNASGVATLNRWTLGTTAGANTLQAAASGLAGSPVVFTATATPAAATQIAVHAGDAQVATVNTAVLTDPAVIARDQFGNPVPGVSVTFTVTGGGGAIAPVSPATVITDINGVAALSSWTLGTGAGANTLSAASGGLAGSPVAFTATGTAGAVSAAQSTVAAAPGSIVASSGGATSAITATARDQFGNPITGATVALTATGTGNTVTQPAGPTGPGGVASGAVSSTFAQAKTVSATINGVPVTQTATVTVTAAAASSIALQAGSGQSATVTTAVAVDPAVIVSDAFGNPVGGVNVTFTVTAGGGSIAPASPATIATGVDGIAALTSWTLGTSTAQANTLSAASGALAGSPVLFTATATPGAPSATQSSITTLPAVITASSGGSASTVTVTVRDQFNNPVSGVAVAIFTTGTDNAITQPAGPTSASGVTNGTLSSTRAENKTVSATINGVLITQTATLEVTPAAAAQLAFTQQPSNAAANTAISPPVVVTVRDSFGNTVTGFAGTVTMQIAQDASLLQNAQLGGLNPVSVVNGAATFANLAINELGVGYTLRAVAGALSVVSAAFSIIP